MYGDLKSAMAALPLYSMAPGTLVSGEIAGYEAAIRMMDNWFTELLAELFPDTASGYGLALWEEALNLPCGAEGIQERRSRIRSSMEDVPGLFDTQKFNRQLSMLGLELSLTSQGRLLHIAGTQGSSLERLSRLAALLLPNLSPMAEVELEGDGRTWMEWEAGGHNWNYYDRLGLPAAFYETI